MKDYMISIIWVSVIVGIVELITPNMEGSGKYIKYIGGLCVLCVIASPIASIVNNSLDFSSGLKEDLLDGQGGNMHDEYQNIMNDYLIDHSTNELSDKIKEILNDNYEIPKEESRIVVVVDQTSGEPKIEKLQVILSGGSIFRNPYKIEDYFANLLNCTCEVLIE